MWLILLSSEQVVAITVLIAAVSNKTGEDGSERGAVMVVHAYDDGVSVTCGTTCREGALA